MRVGPVAQNSHLQHCKSPLDYAVGIVQHICHVAGPTSLVEDLHAKLRREGIVTAVRDHDTPALFTWLMSELSYQGIADSVAEDFIARHGNVAWGDIAASVERSDLCPKLATYSTFTNCRYIKSAQTCANPRHLHDCPLPLHPLRNG